MATKFVSALAGDVIKGAEKIRDAKVIVHQSQFDNPDKLWEAGGQCACCGGGPRITGPGDWWLVFRAGLRDSDGVFYGQLCDGPTGEGCLSSIRAENASRPKRLGDEIAAMVMELSGDDIDGAEADMEMFELWGSDVLGEG
jgi:hypothetical protein